MLLKDEKRFPDEEAIADALGESFPAYKELMETISGSEYMLETVWNYYKDGKAWLCKVTYKKKTVFWLSVWDGFFKTGFYFTEKNGTGIASLEIDNDIKESFFAGKPVGKLLPLLFVVVSREQLHDLQEVIKYKKALK